MICIIVYVFSSVPQRVTCSLVFALSTAVLGMFNFGYNTGVINAPQEVSHARTSILT